MIPFFFTRYKNAPLATCVSFCSSMLYVLALLFSVGYAFNWEGIRKSGSLGESLITAGCLAAAGFGLMKLAKWLAIRKQHKLAEKESPVSPSAGFFPHELDFPRCPKCGAKAEENDVYCVNCGTKLSE